MHSELLDSKYRELYVAVHRILVIRLLSGQDSAKFLTAINDLITIHDEIVTIHDELIMVFNQIVSE